MASNRGKKGKKRAGLQYLREQHLKASRAVADGLRTTPPGKVDTHSDMVRAASLRAGTPLLCIGWDNGLAGATKTLETTSTMARLIFQRIVEIVEKRDEAEMRRFLATLEIPLAGSDTPPAD